MSDRSELPPRAAGLPLEVDAMLEAGSSEDLSSESSPPKKRKARSQVSNDPPSEVGVRGGSGSGEGTSGLSEESNFDTASSEEDDSADKPERLEDAVVYVKAFLDALAASKPSISNTDQRKQAQRSQELRERKRQVNRMSALRKRQREKSLLDSLSQKQNDLKVVNRFLKKDSEQLREFVKGARVLITLKNAGVSVPGLLQAVNGQQGGAVPPAGPQQQVAQQPLQAAQQPPNRQALIDVLVAGVQQPNGNAWVVSQLQQALSQQQALANRGRIPQGQPQAAAVQPQAPQVAVPAQLFLQQLLQHAPTLGLQGVQQQLVQMLALQGAQQQQQPVQNAPMQQQPLQNALMQYVLAQGRGQPQAPAQDLAQMLRDLLQCIYRDVIVPG